MQWIKAFATSLLLLLPLRAAETFQIDPVHSELGFRVKHLGISKVYGRFAAFQGTIVLDGPQSKVDVGIDAASINTENSMRDKDLRSPNFFDVARFPAITFKSVAVKEASKDQYEVTGDFTMHGVTRRLTIPVTLTGRLANPKGDRVGFEGSLTLNRSDYGITYMPGIVSEDVAITLGIEAVKVDAK